MSSSSLLSWPGMAVWSGRLGGRRDSLWWTPARRGGWRSLLEPDLQNFPKESLYIYKAAPLKKFLSYANAVILIEKRRIFFFATRIYGFPLENAESFSSPPQSTI